MATLHDRGSIVGGGKVDAVVATYTITPKKALPVDFAGPYLPATQRIMVATQNQSIQKQSDLAGATVCAVQGSTSADTLAKIGAETYPVGRTSECLEPYGIAVAGGDASFAPFIDSVIAQAVADGRWAADWRATVGDALPLPASPTTPVR